ncbi:LuxR family transcriptional regulator [Streptomyces sp. NPDC050504]|uniref:LuxR family transcriptional regulator n=1 Tax=Streptomyces sp. NPDC050504 TaxID=3365618 RepID=UPI0037B8B834
MPEQRGDAVEQALRQVQSLIESTVAMHRDLSHRERQIVRIDGGYDGVADAARELIDSAVTSVAVVHAQRIHTGKRSGQSGQGPAQNPTTGPARGAEQGAVRVPAQRDRRASAYGTAHGTAHGLVQRVPAAVPVRVLISPALLTDAFVREHEGVDRPVAVRVARVPPLQALIVDDTTALVASDGPNGPRASVIRAPEVLHTLGTFYETVWDSAVPAAESLVFGDPYRARIARQVLRAMRAGVTDEVAARELTVSVRTYRRYVAEVMALLGAQSRFQAGVRAAELGLVPLATS